MATKRSLETGEEAGIKKTKLDDESKASTLETRVLIDNYEAGIIIGKGGSNVTKVRAESGAYCSILKNETGQTKERVMVLKGTAEANATALQLIAQLLLDAAATRAAQQQEQGVEIAAPDNLAVKILIHKFLAGSVIGKGGAIIKQIMADTGARLQLSNEPLVGSTEKTVTVTGVPDTIHAACLRVITQVRDNPLRSGSSSIPYIPGGALAFPSNPYGVPTPYGAAPVQQGLYGQQQPMYGGAPQQASPYGAPAPAPGTQKTEKIVIPTVCAGSVIGKGGSIIRDIKAQSGTSITIADPEPTAQNDRVVSVTGTPQGIQTAIYLIRQRVEAYQPPGGAPPQF